MYFLNLSECHETDTGKAKDKSISMPAVFAEPAKCFLLKQFCSQYIPTGDCFPLLAMIFDDSFFPIFSQHLNLSSMVYYTQLCLFFSKLDIPFDFSKKAFLLGLGTLFFFLIKQLILLPPTSYFYIKDTMYVCHVMFVNKNYSAIEASKRMCLRQCCF